MGPSNTNQWDVKVETTRAISTVAVAVLTALITASVQLRSNTSSVDTLETRTSKLNEDISALAARKAALSVIPVGTIVAFGGEFSPAALKTLEQLGWLPCTGLTKTKAEFPQLYEALQGAYGNTPGSDPFRLPDLRGQFLRGLDLGVGLDPARKLGQPQLDAVAHHRHGILTASGPEAAAPGYSQGNVQGYGTKLVGNGQTEDAAATTPGGVAQETRPVNIAVNYIIKY